MRPCARLLAKKTLSSHLWLERQSRDLYVKEREKQGYVARSAFKLQEMDERRHFLRPGVSVLDLGAAPGGWTQVALRRGCSPVVSCDLLPHSIEQNDPFFGSLRWVKGDFTTPEVQARLLELLGGQCDVMLCDAAPSYAGQASTDHLRLMGLAHKALQLSDTLLKPTDGTLVVKVSRGGEEARLRDELKKKFAKVEFIKPDASRKDSSEMYLLSKR